MSVTPSSFVGRSHVLHDDLQGVYMYHWYTVLGIPSCGLGPFLRGRRLWDTTVLTCNIVDTSSLQMSQVKVITSCQLLPTETSSLLYLTFDRYVIYTLFSSLLLLKRLLSLFFLVVFPWLSLVGYFILFFILTPQGPYFTSFIVLPSLTRRHNLRHSSVHSIPDIFDW